MTALLTIVLPGNDEPSMQLFDGNMNVLAPSRDERESVRAILIEALAILSPVKPRHSEDSSKLRVIK